MKFTKRAWLLLICLSLCAISLFAQSEPVEDSGASYSLGDFFKLLGSLGLFLFGMKYMSEGIQRAAGSNLRNILRKVTSNSFFGIITGLFITTLIQSSSATTVMVVSFTNAGLFSLTEAIGVIMGANIGTTVTGWIIAVFGLKVSVAKLSLPILALAFPLMFFKNDKIKNWAEAIVGFALLFLGLGLLKDSVPDINSNPEVLDFIQGWSDNGFWSLLTFIGVGTLLTVVIQSSSATMALTLVLLSKGWIDFPSAAAMVLGENIGTTITAQLAGLIANLNAKRAAMAHTLFNLTGVIWMLFLFQPFLRMVEWIVSKSIGMYCSVFKEGCDISPDQVNLFSTNPDLLESIAPVGLAVFHTAFNLINVLLLVGFVPLMAKAVQALLKKGEDTFNSGVLKYLDAGMMNTPELALIEAQKEVREFALLTRKMYKANMVLLYKDGSKKAKKAFGKISAYEEECDEKEREIARYLANLSSKNLSKSTAERVRRIWSVINDLERVGDLNEKIMLNFQNKMKTVHFDESGIAGLKQITDKVDAVFDALFDIFDQRGETPLEKDDIEKMEVAINEERDHLRNSFFVEIENSTISFQTGLVAVELVSNLEKIADHLYSINSEMLKLDINS